MDISVVIINWNTKELVLQCIRSVYDTISGLDVEIWMVDNGSSDGSVEAVKETFPAVRIIENGENLGFAKANNRALAKISGKYALLLNSDAVLTPGAVAALFNFMERTPEAGMTCGQLLNEDGSLQNSFANFPTLASLLVNESALRLIAPHRYKSKTFSASGPTEIESGIGACLMVRKAAMETVGLMDERYFFFLEETDWALCMRRAGWKSFFVPGARIYHFQGRSVGHSINSRILYYESRYLYFKKWHSSVYWMVPCLVFSRLLVNLAANGAGVVLTLGLAAGLRAKLSVYAGLLRWHFSNLQTVFSKQS